MCATCGVPCEHDDLHAPRKGVSVAALKHQMQHGLIHSPLHGVEDILLDMNRKQDGIIALLQRILDETLDANGLPEGDPYNLLQASPAQNTLYVGPVIASLPSVLRSMVLTTNATNVFSVYLIHDHGQEIFISGVDQHAVGKLLFQGQINNNGLVLENYRLRMPANCKIGIATAGAGINTIAFSAVVDQVEQYATKMFAGRR